MEEKWNGDREFIQAIGEERGGRWWSKTPWKTHLCSTNWGASIGASRAIHYFAHWQTLGGGAGGVKGRARGARTGCKGGERVLECWVRGGRERFEGNGRLGDG